MENREIARMLSETADLMEIAGEDGFRIRSYRNAASAIEGYPERIDDILRNPERKVTEIPGIGKGIASVLEEIGKRGSFEKRDELLRAVPAHAPRAAEDPGPRPQGHRAALPALQGRHHRRSGAHLQGTETARAAAHGREARREGAQVHRAVPAAHRPIPAELRQKAADELIPYLSEGGGLDQDRRRRQPAPRQGDHRRSRSSRHRSRRADALERFVNHPKAHAVLGKGANKASIQYGLEGLQVDLRALAAESYGAAMQYFTGSKEHNIVLRLRAQKLGLTLNEYGLFRVEGEARVAGETEEEVYAALGLAWIPPELRENCGEIEAALRRPSAQAGRTRPTSVAISTCTPPKPTAARRSRKWPKPPARSATNTSPSPIIRRPSPWPTAWTRSAPSPSPQQVREMNQRGLGLRVFSGLECDIRRDGDMDLAEDALAELDIVIGSVHSHMNLEAAEMTDRLMRALESPHVRVLGHPTGRMLLHRDSFPFDFERVATEAARRNVYLEINASPERLDLRGALVRTAKALGAKFVISTDSHQTKHLGRTCPTESSWRAAAGWRPATCLNTLCPRQFARPFKNHETDFFRIKIQEHTLFRDGRSRRRSRRLRNQARHRPASRARPS